MIKEKNIVKRIAVTDSKHGQRLDNFLIQALQETDPDSEQELSRTRLQQLITQGYITQYNQKDTRITAAQKVQAGQEYEVVIPPPKPMEARAYPIPLNILYEDAHVLVLNKAAGMVTHPAPGHQNKTLVNALLAHCEGSISDINGSQRPGIVHRLDKDTSGVMVVAKNNTAHVRLARQFAAHGRDGKLHRAYKCFLWGLPIPPRGRVEGSIARSPRHRKKMAVVSHGGKAAATRFRVIDTYNPTQDIKMTLAECEPETGRTHQIRLHMSHLGYPIVCDSLYGGTRRASLLPDDIKTALKNMARQALHAYSLSFEHPISKKPMKFTAPMPQDMDVLQKTLELYHIDRSYHS